jgi:hypothetical protein
MQNMQAESHLKASTGAHAQAYGIHTLGSTALCAGVWRKLEAAPPRFHKTSIKQLRVVLLVSPHVHDATLRRPGKTLAIPPGLSGPKC